MLNELFATYSRVCGCFVLDQGCKRRFGGEWYYLEFALECALALAANDEVETPTVTLHNVARVLVPLIRHTLLSRIPTLVSQPMGDADPRIAFPRVGAFELLTFESAPHMLTSVIVFFFFFFGLSVRLGGSSGSRGTRRFPVVAERAQAAAGAAAARLAHGQGAHESGIYVGDGKISTALRNCEIAS